MNISGIRPSTGFYDENAVKFHTDIDLGSMSAEELENEKPPLEYGPAATVSLSTSQDEIGFRSLDVQKAVSDMQNDETIQRYQYFVQNKEGTEGTDTPGMENFTL